MDNKKSWIVSGDVVVAFSVEVEAYTAEEATDMVRSMSPNDLPINISGTEAGIDVQDCYEAT